MKPAHLHILQHSLGLDRFGQGTMYRNHFASGPSCDHYVLCRELVELGYMTEHPPPSWSEYSGFKVTEAGKGAVREHSPAPPKRTRSQKRYQRFLDADSGLSFGEWIREEAR